jgi:hypothetical protein
MAAKGTSNAWAFRVRNNVYWKRQRPLLDVTALGQKYENEYFEYYQRNG